MAARFDLHTIARPQPCECANLIAVTLAIDKLILCYDGIDGTNFLNATKSVMDAIGLLQVTQLSVYEAGRALTFPLRKGQTMDVMLDLETIAVALIGFVSDLFPLPRPIHS